MGLQTDQVELQSSGNRISWGNTYPFLRAEGSHVVVRNYNNTDYGRILTLWLGAVARFGTRADGCQIYAFGSPPGGPIVSFTTGSGGPTLVEIANDSSIKQKSATYGGDFSRKKYEAVATLSGASTTLQTNIPGDALIIGYQFIVEELITSGDGATSWKATLSGGASDELFTGQAFTKNTKKKKRIVGIETSSEVDVDIEPDSGTFSGGKIACVFLVEEASDLDSFA